MPRPKLEVGELDTVNIFPDIVPENDTKLAENEVANELCDADKT
jgi:hypothetical protein